MNKFIELLNKTYPMSPELKSKIYDSLLRIELRPNDHLLKGGQIPSNLYFVESGLLESYFKVGDDRHYSAFWPAESVIYYHRNIWNRTAADDFLVAQRSSIVYGLSYDSLCEIRELFPAFSFHIAKFQELMNIELEMKYRILSMRYTDGRVLKFRELYGNIAYEIPVTHLVNFLCMTESTYYRILSLQRPVKKRVKS